MEAHPFTNKNWFVVALIALALGLWFVSAYLGVIAFAALMAFLFFGIYERLQKKTRSSVAAILTFLFSLVVVLIPVGIVAVFTASQLARFSDVTAALGNDFSSLPAVLQSAIADINNFTQRLGLTQQFITNDGLSNFLKTTIPEVLSAIVSFLTSFVGSIPFMIILAILYIFLFYEFLVYGKKIIETIVALSPFQPNISRIYLERIGLMANAMAKGQLAMAVIIASLEALVLALFFGIWDFFFLMAVAFTIFNLIPLGAGIIIYPLILIFMLFGEIWPGVGALVAISIVSNLESVLRPRFIPKEITLTNSLTMLAAFSGIALFGILGVVYGPIIMVIIVTTIQIYEDYYQKKDPLKETKRIAARQKRIT